MAITKSKFINYTRCPKYLLLDKVSNDILLCDISYEEYLEEEKEELRREILSSFLDSKELKNNYQVEAMMPYYKKVEILAASIAKKCFGDNLIFNEETKKQKCFEAMINNIKYLCYIDIYNETENEINIIEVKSTTTAKYLKLNCKDIYDQKSPVFEKKGNIIKLKNKNLFDSNDYQKIYDKLLDRTTEEGSYLFDIAVQRYFIEHSKSINKKINYYLAVLNSNYIYDGNGEYHEINNEELITFIDVNNITLEYQSIIEDYRLKLETYLLAKDYQKEEIGKYCGYKTVKECPFFKKYCAKDLPEKNSIFNFIKLRSFKSETGENLTPYQMFNKGYRYLTDVPINYLSNPRHVLQYNLTKDSETYIDKEKIQTAINSIEYPIYHLDFETFPCPIPRFRGEKPFSQSPFEFSLHIERKGETCDLIKDNYVFLASSFNDERELLIKTLLKYIDPNKGTMLAQNCMFEKNCLKSLAECFPKYSEDLMKIYNRAFDLLWLVDTNKELYQSLGFDENRSSLFNFYDSKLSGSYSIKKTLPVFSDLTYSNLEVKNGTEAIWVYANYPNMNNEELAKAYQDLTVYCRQDTWAMVVILQSLREIVK